MAKGGPDAVSRDTQVFEEASFNYQTKAFQAVGKHLDNGDLRLIITDITVREVHARIANAVDKELELQRKFRGNARVLKHATGGPRISCRGRMGRCRDERDRNQA